METSSNTTKTTSTTAWWLNEDAETRKAILVLRTFERIVRKRVSGYSAVPAADILKSAKFATAKTLVAWLEENGYKITLNRSHWQGYIKFAASQKPSLFIGQLKNPLLFARYCSQASFRVPAPKPQRSVDRLIGIYNKVLSPELSDLKFREALGLTETLVRKAIED